MKAKITKAEYEALKSADIKAEYLERDGSFFAKIEEVDGWGLDHVAGLKETLSDRKEKHRLASEKLALYGETTPEKVTALLAELAQLKESGSGSKVTEAAKAAIEKQLREFYDGELKKKDDTNKQLMSEIEDIVVDSSLKSDIVEAGGLSVKGLLPQLKAVTRMEKVGGKWVKRVYGADGNPILTRKPGEHGDMQPVEYCDVFLRKDPELAALFKARAAQGDGGGQGSGNRGGGDAQVIDPKLSGTDLLKRARSDKSKATA